MIDTPESSQEQIEDSLIIENRKSNKSFKQISSHHLNQTFPKYSFLEVELLEKIGKGGCGEVFKIYNKRKNKFLALKYYTFSDPEEEIDQLILENSIIQDLNFLNHPNFLIHYGFYIDPKHSNTYLLEQELGLINMNEIIQAGKIYTCEEIVYIIMGICQGLNLLETRGIAHRDLKPENIILIPDKTNKEQYIYKVYDFGIGCKLENDEKMISRESLLGFTKTYSSPEVLKMNETKIPYYNPFKADVYSLGMILLKMMGIQNIGELEKMGIYYADLKSLIQRMIKTNPKERPSFKEIEENLKTLKSQRPVNEREFVEKRLRAKEKENGGLSEDQIIERNMNFFQIYFYKLSRYQEAKHYLDKTLEILDKNPSKITEKASFLNYLGSYYEIMGKYKNAEETYLEAYKIQEIVKEPKILIKILKNLAYLYQNMGKIVESEGFYEKALGIAKGVYGEDNSEIAEILCFLGSLYHNSGKFKEAEEIYLKSIQILQPDMISDFFSKKPKKMISSKESQEKNAKLASSFQNLGELYLKTGNYHSSEENLKKALDLRMNIFGEINRYTAETFDCFGQLYIKKDNLLKADEFFAKSSQIKEEIFGEYNHNMIITLINAASLNQKTLYFIKSEEILQNSLKLIETLCIHNKALTSKVLNNLGILYVKMRNFEKGKEIYQKIFTNKENMLGIWDSETGDVLNIMGMHFLNSLDFQLAEKFLMMGLKIREKIIGRNNLNDFVHTFENLGNLFLKQKIYEKAEEYFTKALKTYERFPIENYKDQGECINNLKYVKEKLGNFDKTKEYERQIKQINDTNHSN